MTTETTGKLAEALAAFQAEMPTVPKTQTAKVPTKAGGSYSYTYAGLADVTEAAMPILTRHGLSFSCLPGTRDGGYELLGMLLHASGERLTASLPIRGVTPQEIGSALTYMRRYLFGCMTGLVTDDDEDGQLASQSKPLVKRGNHPPGSSFAAKDVSEAQVKLIGTLMGKLGMTDRDPALAFVADVIGRPVASRNELTSREASAVIDALQKDLGEGGADA